MRIAVCDDEEAQRILLTKYLQEWAKQQNILLEVVPFLNAEGFLFCWAEDKAFDLLVLDIEMGEINGMELAMKLREQYADIPILFVTGYESYMAQGYEVSALHYLLKPIHKEKLFQVLDKFQKTKKPEDKLLLQTESGSIFILPSDIWYVEATGHQSVLYTSNRECRIKHSISEVKDLLQDKSCFISSHRSYLVNMQHVSAIVKAELVMDNNVKLPISRGMTKQVNEAFIRVYTG
ncbi:MAG: response regulator transcription factor [Lachnospiraceae bacterium]|nr:response regulator transcription factor [Lachnospiraceae bacterium]